MSLINSAAPARGARYVQLLNGFLEYGEIVSCEPRYAIVRRPFLVQHMLGGESTHVYWYGIGCFMCGKISWNPTDVKAHYCGHCQMFHDNA